MIKLLIEKCLKQLASDLKKLIKKTFDIKPTIAYKTAKIGDYNFNVKHLEFFTLTSYTILLVRVMWTLLIRRAR